jgi:two-component system sensor histidine kinase UhpB
MALLDIDVVKRSLDEARQARQRAEELSRSELAISESTNQAVLSVAPDGKITMVNPATEKMFGYGRDEVLGQPLEMLLPESRREAHAGHLARYFAAPESRPMGANLNLNGRRKDGEEFPIEIALRPIETAEGTRAVALIADLTERKQAKQALQESRAQLSLASQVAGIGTWDWNIAANETVYSPEWGPLYGLPSGAALRPEEWRAAIHPDDRKRVQNELKLALDGGKPYITEFRVVWPDGTVHWLIGKGEILRDPAGRSVRMLGANMDITERRSREEELRASEAQLQALTASLFTAQEDERKRLARELHDDFNQRMAMLANDVVTLEKELPPDSARRLRAQLKSLRAKVDTLSDDLRGVAYRLQPPALEHFGLVAALETLCSEFSKNYRIKLKFLHRRIVPTLRGEVALSLYRVVQESLNNVAKHSAATEVIVSLERTKHRIRLSISDNGQGYESALQASGLGLVSIRERIRVVGGAVRIDPGLGSGTRVEVEVPLEEAAS